jgi:hypothetical protein
MSEVQSKIRAALAADNFDAALAMACADVQVAVSRLTILDRDRTIRRFAEARAHLLDHSWRDVGGGDRPARANLGLFRRLGRSRDDRRHANAKTRSANGFVVIDPVS